MCPIWIKTPKAIPTWPPHDQSCSKIGQSPPTIYRKESFPVLSCSTVKALLKAISISVFHLLPQPVISLLTGHLLLWSNMPSINMTVYITTYIPSVAITLVALICQMFVVKFFSLLQINSDLPADGFSLSLIPIFWKLNWKKNMTNRIFHLLNGKLRKC